ncbi:MAG: type II toxin-antitoxin system PemK/MazF family toxin [Limnospira sp. PMC 1261.20]|uniref:type II toxin-antitoxin system PemK/MazF family toxin n=1 Tax=Limnospira sp. PMC 1261.20 TaxID=2981059 RepID=UPI0028E17937|nr:type II toxin-antitoxin system PemK/MazF family toxin [Limnospira sp. PMC 1261.20]MDT9241904.1 type II toxin-antitoxin system PemK/MazF family toxin [Limnospira sp. PMC 1261.20]
MVNLDPTIGSEIQKKRPCVMISPDEMNLYIATVIIAPMTTKGKAYPTRISCQFQGKEGQIVLDQTPSIKLDWSKRCFPNEPRDGAIALP